MEIGDLHDRAFRRFAERELQDKLVALAAADDDRLAGFDLSGSRRLTVQGAVALFFLVVVEQNLKRHILVAAHVRGDAVADARLRDQTGLDIELGLPHAGIPGCSKIVDAYSVAAATKHRGVALVVLFPNDGLSLKVHRNRERVLVIDFVRKLLDLDL